MTTPRPFLVAAGLAVAVFGLAAYANLARRVTDGAAYRYYPPFERHTNANNNHELGAEYFNVATALAAGDGFADPFPVRTGPTAWMPPAYPLLLAGLLRATGGDRGAVMTAVVFLQVYTLVGTGVLVVALARRAGGRAGVGAAAFLVGTLLHFHACYQTTHDPWLVLLAVDLVVAGACWLRPLSCRRAAAGWGAFGGCAALVSPIVGLVWGVLTVFLGRHRATWPRLAVAAAAAGLAVGPWVTRNAVVFGRFIPVKSNLAYELYQSQVLTRDGLIQRPTFQAHPYVARGGERAEYADLGEAAFLDRKRDQFRAAVRADPLGFVERALTRFWAATVWYVPFDRAAEDRRPVRLWLHRAAHPVPFLALLVLAATAGRRPLDRTEWVAAAVYAAYLLPYVAVSYYERYAVPLLGVKAVLVAFAGGRLYPRAAGR